MWIKEFYDGAEIGDQQENDSYNLIFVFYKFYIVQVNQKYKAIILKKTHLAESNNQCKKEVLLEVLDTYFERGLEFMKDFLKLHIDRDSRVLDASYQYYKKAAIHMPDVEDLIKNPKSGAVTEYVERLKENGIY